MVKLNYTKTSVTQPRELWNKVRTDALNQSKPIDEILTNILKQHYEVKQ